MNKKICIVYTHHKLGDLIWQLPYIKAISDHHDQKVDLVVRKKNPSKTTQNHANTIITRKRTYESRKTRKTK